ncbi:MAG: dockerin type I domain-containing protein, partial [Bacteroidota bacterium]
NTYHANGVSTLDLVLIQRHILKLKDLDSPYKVIAADINNSGKVTSADLLDMRKLILGIWTEFEDNNSWRFVDATQEFPVISNPFPFDEKINVLNFTDGAPGNDFVGVKIGDVNNSAAYNAQSKEESTVRNKQVLSLTLENAEFTTGDLISIPVTADNFDEMIGFQFTLESNGLELETIESGALEMSLQNVGQFSKKNALTFSWNSIDEVTVDSDEVLFTIVMRAKTNNNLNNTLALTSTITTAEAYTSSLEITDVEMNVREGEVSIEEVGFELYQNTPNPFASITTIPFNLPKSGNVTLNVFDITGKNILNQRGSFEKGMNEIRIENADLSTKGIMYYQLEFDGVVATRKMISM